jgi:exonuclease III
MPDLKIITLNVERDRHWHEIIPFLQREMPEVLCLQEVFEEDAKMLASRFGYDYIHIPITRIPHDLDPGGPPGLVGPSLFSKLPLKNKDRAYYYEAAQEIQLYRGGTEIDKRATIHEGIAWGTVEKEGVDFKIASLHFTWTHNGLPNKDQERDIASLFKILDKMPELLLCGDFNVPRGYNHIYDQLTARYKDNIPKEIETTLDISKHRVGKDPVEGPRIAKYVVDYIFSTPEYKVSEVRVIYGISDHAAIAAKVTK